MSLVLLFLLLLILMFGVLVYLLKPTSMEKAVEEQLASIEEVQPAGGVSTTILKERVAGSTMVEQFAQRLPWSLTGSRLIKQAGQDWSFGSVSAVSLIAGLALLGGIVVQCQHPDLRGSCRCCGFVSVRVSLHPS